ncbi:MAG: hypothetical protein ABJL67_17315 [Sulfitobacter sp.]
MLAHDDRSTTVIEAKTLLNGAGDPTCIYHGVSLSYELPIAVVDNLIPLSRLSDMAAA